MKVDRAITVHGQPAGAAIKGERRVLRKVGGEADAERAERVVGIALSVNWAIFQWCLCQAAKLHQFYLLKLGTG